LVIKTITALDPDDIDSSAASRNDPYDHCYPCELNCIWSLNNLVCSN